MNDNLIYTDNQNLFRYNGSSGSLIKQINPSGSYWGNNFNNVHDFAILNNKMYFLGGTSSGDEPWVTDGTFSGTYQLQDLVPGSGGSSPKGFLEINNKIFFMTTTNPVKVMLYDPTLDSMTVIKTFPISYYIPNQYLIKNIVKVDSSLIVFAIETNDGFEIWQTDGTGVGTIPAEGIYAELTKNLDVGGYFRMIEFVVRNGDYLYMQVNFADARGKKIIKVHSPPN